MELFTSVGILRTSRGICGLGEVRGGPLRVSVRPAGLALGTRLVVAATIPAQEAKWAELTNRAMLVPISVIKERREIRR